MRQCYQAVINAATGRNLTKAEVQNIFDNIFKSQRELARSDPNWATYSAQEKLQRAAEYGVNEAVHQKQLKQQRVALTILARDRIDNAIADMLGRGVAKNEVEALNRIVAYNPDNKTGFQSLDTRANATRNWAIGQMLDAFDKSKLLGMFEDESHIRDLVREMFGEETGNAEAKTGAQQWQQQTELLRETFNASGGDIGHLDNWGLPQEHSQIKTAKAGEQQWLDDILPAIDREKYVHSDGRLMNDDEINTLFASIYQTVSTGGINKLQASGQKISSMVANRRNEARQIFFKNADSFFRYHEKYGDHGIFDIMMHHISGISRDIALLETFGPNPDLMFRSVLDDAKKLAVAKSPIKANNIVNRADKTSALYDYVAGNYSPVVHSRVAKTLDSVRALLTSAKLGSAAITAIGDQGTLALMAKTNGISLGAAYKTMLNSLNPLHQRDKRFAQRNGLALDTVISSLNRFGVDNMRNGLPQKLASAVLRLSGLMKITDAAKEGYAASMMSAVGHVVRSTRDLSALVKTSQFDAELIKRHGVSDTDFAVWKQAELEEISGVKNMLTPESVMAIPDERLNGLGDPTRLKFEAARKLIGMLAEESDVAVVTPGSRDRFNLGASQARGSLSGEILRSITQFKSFPFALVARMWARGAALPTGLQKAYFGGSLLLGTTFFGAMALQMNNVASGRKPQDMQDTSFWIEAMLKGGALGVYGDFIFSDKNSYGATLGEMAIGPLGSSLAQFADLTLGNVRKLYKGEETHAGAETIRLFKGVTPGANMWYSKAVSDHLVFNQLQEAVSPGYLDKYMNYQRKRGTKFWWRPDDPLPR